MDRTQPHFACRKGILKKRGMPRKHELFSLSESPASNKQNAHNLIFQNKGPCPTCAEAVRRLSLPSPASFQLVDPRGKNLILQRAFLTCLQHTKKMGIQRNFTTFSSPQL